MPPLRTHERQDDAAHHDPHQRRDRDDAEHVDPRADVVRLAVGEQVVHREDAIPGLPNPKRPAACLATFNVLNFGQMYGLHVMLLPITVTFIVVVQIVMVRSRGVVKPIGPEGGAAK